MFRPPESRYAGTAAGFPARHKVLLSGPEPLQSVILTQMAKLFAGGFEGLPIEGFSCFGIPEAEKRRKAIIETFHAPLERLSEDLLPALKSAAGCELYAHLPRLNWPAGYRPFCTWLAISTRAQGYQMASQLNFGIHHDYVAARLSWDVRQDAFGRFEFLCRLGRAGRRLLQTIGEENLKIRVYAAAPWPEGSREVFVATEDLAGSFEAVRRNGVWWEIGLKLPLKENSKTIGSAVLGEEVERVFRVLLPHMLTAH